VLHEFRPFIAMMLQRLQENGSRNVGGYFLTSVALVAAVHKILRGEIRERGVMTAETAFRPLSFFEEVVDVLPDPPPGGKLIGESFEWLE